MLVKDFYNSINNLEYECNCTSISIANWDKLMEGALRADKYKTNRLVKEHLPYLFKSLGLDQKSLKDLNRYNPYNYYKTKTHLILVHSNIEYFLKIKT